jgi:hypothetical protein
MDVLEAMMCIMDSLQTESASGGVLVLAELVSDGGTVVFERDGRRHVFKMSLEKVGSVEAGAFE